jgi:protein ImuA
MRASDFMVGGSFAPRLPASPSQGKAGGAQGPAELESRVSPAAPELPPLAEGEETVAALLRRLQQSPALRDFVPPRRDLPLLPLAIPHLDALLAGGLRRDGLHEIRSNLSRDSGAATGFAAAILARLTMVDAKPVLWIVEAASAEEAGALYGVGLERLGLDPKRLIVVRVRKAIDALWVAEEGLTCRGLAAVLAEIKGAPRLLDLTATRRLALRARSGVMGLLLRQSDVVEPSAATTRWLAEPLPATARDGYAAGIGLPAWRLVLERNRRGTTGAIDVEWDHGRRSLAALAGGTAGTAHPVALPAVSVDRPAPPPEAGKVVALPVLPSWSQSPREIRRRIARAR